MGQDEEPFATVGRADLGSAEQSPFRIEPEMGQRVHDFAERPPSVDTEQSSDVLKEDEAGSGSGHKPSDIWPEPAVVSATLAATGVGGGLTREAGSEDIHSSAPRCASEAREIVPHRSAIQGRFSHPRHEQGRGEAVPLDIAHSAVVLSQGQLEAQFDSPDAGADGEPSEGTCSHT